MPLETSRRAATVAAMRFLTLVFALTLTAVACTGARSGLSPELELAEVVDGDTLRLRVAGTVEEVRLVGVNTPEFGECYAEDATAALAELVAGGELRVELAGTGERDRFGRLLRYVYAGENLINLDLVETGAGLALFGDHPQQRVFAAAGDRARLAGLGMWRDSVCGPVGFGDVEILEVESDPAGDDNDRPNAEFVALRNAGADTADLSGWILRDESSSNRLEIPNGLLLQAGAVLTIRSGCGTDSDTELFWCSGPIWSNGGDTVILQAPNGSVVDAVSYR